MTTAQVVETSVTNNSSFQNYTHPDDHTTRNTDTPGFKPFTLQVIYCKGVKLSRKLWCIAGRAQLALLQFKGTLRYEINRPYPRKNTADCTETIIFYTNFYLEAKYWPWRSRVGSRDRQWIRCYRSWQDIHILVTDQWMKQILSKIANHLHLEWISYVPSERDFVRAVKKHS